MTIASWIAASAGVSALLWFFAVAPVLTRILYGDRAMPLDPEALARCAEVVKGRRGYPYVCRTALQRRRCPCRPCAKIGDEPNVRRPAASGR